MIVPRADVELWNNEIRTSASSPILAGDRVYVTSEIGYLVAWMPRPERCSWKLKLGIEQRNSSPLYADGRIYAPILNDPGTSAAVGEESAAGGHGALYVIKPGDDAGQDYFAYRAGGPLLWNAHRLPRPHLPANDQKALLLRAGQSPRIPSYPNCRALRKNGPRPAPPRDLQAIPSELLIATR